MDHVRGEYAAARSFADHALTLSRQLGDTRETAAALCTRWQSWQASRATTHWLAHISRRVWRSGGNSAVAGDRTLALDINLARAALGDEAFAAAWARGENMGIEQAIANA